MSSATSAPAVDTWGAIVVMLCAFLLLFTALHFVARVTTAHPETTRKMLHAGSGVLTLAFPFVFGEAWPVLVLTGAAASLIAAVKFVPALRERLGRVSSRVERPTLGELYFPFSVALLFWLTRGDDPLLFVIPMLMLTFADATSALVGTRYGITPYHGASKSLEGSVAFAVVAFFCVHVPLLLWSDVGPIESLLIATTLSLLVMLLEGSAWRGLDNLFIPIGGYFLLRVYVTLAPAALVPRLLVTVALVALVILVRRRATLKDDSLVAGAFLCYVAWAVMGWQWLVAPLAIVAGYRWLSAATADNSRRMHDVPAVLSVWAPAILWLALARTSDQSALLFPYTIAFGAHLAMFGTSRLASQFREKPLLNLYSRAVVMSGVIILVPFVLVAGAMATPMSAITTAVVAIGSIAVGTAVFVGTQPGIRNAPQTARRWVHQAGAASLASAVAWGGAVSADLLG